MSYPPKPPAPVPLDWPTPGNPPPAFICPRCYRSTWSPLDAQHGWCTNCRTYTVWVAEPPIPYIPPSAP